MKKGISQPMIAIVLGLIFIVLVLVAFGLPLKEYVNNMFTKGVFVVKNETTSYIAGTTKGELALPYEELSGPVDSVELKIARKLVNCYNKMRAKNNDNGAQNEPCEKIKVTSLENRGDSLPISEVVKFIKDNPDNSIGYAQSYRDLMIEGLKSGWKQLYSENPTEKGTVDVGVTYLICADLDGGRDTSGSWTEDTDELFMARDLNFKCE